MRHRLLATLILILALLSARAVARAAPPAAQGPAIPSYRLQASVDYDRGLLQVDETVRFRNQTGQTLDHAVFQVVAAWAGAFRLQAASAQGQPAAAGLDGSLLEVPLPAPLPPGGTVEVGLSFALDVPARPGRLNAGPNALALGNWFPTLVPHRGDWDRHQFTDVGDAFVNEVADFEVSLTTSRPVAIASTGRALEDSGTSFRLQALSVRDFALSLSSTYVPAEVQVGTTTVRALTASRSKSRAYADAAAKFFRWYEQRFGAYPYRTLTLAEVDLPASYGGLEYPSLIFLPSSLGLPADGNTADILIGHEVAHQWFYSLVGNDQIRDPWLDEAFATYLPYYYYSDVAPALFASVFSGNVLQGLDDRVRAAGGFPVNSTTDDFTNDGPYFTIVYRQGARFLNDLRQAMGDGAFDEALADEVATFADKLASPRAVLDLFQRHTAANLNPLIARYFTYGAFGDPSPPSWRVELPDSPWRGSADLFVGADFPVAWVEAWLDDRRLYAGDQNAVRLDLSGAEAGDYVLVVRALDHRGTQFERARRISITAP